MPHYYGYPSLVYWINAAGALPDVAAVWPGAARRERLLAAMDAHGYLLRLRAVYLIVASLSLVWVYWLVCTASRRRGSGTGTGGGHRAEIRGDNSTDDDPAVEAGPRL